ncbi:hypothetical protein M569_06972, partial [Genlisea aurea]
LTITTLHFLVPNSIGAAASTRVSNELGAGKCKSAQRVLSAVLFLSMLELIVAIAALSFGRYVIGYAFSNETRVVDYVKDMVPFLCSSIFTDGLQAVLSGIVRGIGRQQIGAYINLAAYYIVGIPVALLLGFVFDFKGKGLWSGLVAGGAVQDLLLCVVAFRTDWQKQ